MPETPRSWLEHQEHEIYILDEAGNETGKTTVRQAHESGYRHATDQIFVFEDEFYRNLLLSKRSQFQHAARSKIQPSAAGHVGDRTCSDPYFAAFEILHRQLFYRCKELPGGIYIAKIAHYPNHYIEENEKTNLEFTRLYRTVCKGPFSLDPEKLESVKFVPIAEIIKEIEESRKAVRERIILSSEIGLADEKLETVIRMSEDQDNQKKYTLSFLRALAEYMNFLKIAAQNH